MINSARRRGKIIVFGLVFWYPLAGVTYQFLHYLNGLRKIGWDVYYVEDSARSVYDVDGGEFTYDYEGTGNIPALGPVLDAHGYAGRWAFHNQHTGSCYGMTLGELRCLYLEADVLLNVTGGQELLAEHGRIPRKIYVETDPVKTEILVAQGDQGMIEALDGHDTHFTFGENFGASDCGVPVERYRWLPTRQPVDLDLWPQDDSPGTAYTTVATWNNRGSDIEWKGEVYGWSKRPEFLKIQELPRQRPQYTFELASMLPDDDRTRFAQLGWKLTDAIALSRNTESYRRYIQRSRGEFTVAKDQNIRLRSGWFSDRSCCYLAAGRPVINQDTAFGNTLPTGRGLFLFRNLEDILAAVDTIESDYEPQRRAAREIAAEYFAAEKVLESLCTRAGL